MTTSPCLQWPLKAFEWLRILVYSLAFFSLTKLIFALWNLREWPTLSFREWGQLLLLSLRGDLATSTLLLSPWILLSLIPLPESYAYRTRTFTIISTKVLFIPALWANMFDSEWHKFTASRLNFSQLYLLKELSVRDLSAVLIYWPLFLISLGLAWAWWIFFPLAVQSEAKALSSVTQINKEPLHKASATSNESKQKIKNSWLRMTSLFLLRSLFILVVSVTLARGGWQRRPLEPVVFSSFRNQLANILSYNSVLSLMHSWNENLFVVPEWPPFSDTLNSQLKSYHELKRTFPPALQMKPGTNMVVIVVESLAYAFLEQGGGHPEWTPFINSLPQHGATLLPGLASGRRTADGLLAILAGLPAWIKEPVLFTSASQIPLSTINYLFPQHELLFFHGGYEGSLSINHLANKLGFQKYFGFTNFPDPSQDDGAWGIWDHAFLPWVATQLSHHRQPFFTTILTLSSHYPFQLPKNYPTRISPDPEFPILATIAYADDALRLFFEQARQQPWYNETLFVILGDHSVSPLPPNKNLSERSPFEIPIIFYHPQMNLPKLFAEKGLKRKLLSQLDILATLERWLKSPNTTPTNNPFVTPIEVPDEHRLSIHRSQDCLQMLTLDKILRSCDGQTMDAQYLSTQTLHDKHNEKNGELLFQALVAFYIHGLQVRSWSLLPK